MSQGEAGSLTGGNLTKRGIALAIALAALLACVLASPASAALMHHRFDAGPGAKISAAAMQRAKPLPLPAVSAQQARSAASAAATAPTAKPHYVPGHVPAGAAVTAAFSRAAAGASGFGRFQSHAVADPTVYPQTTNGKLVGKIPGVGVYSCSASVVHGKNRSTLFTAGHCVKDPGGPFATKLQFAPAYDNGDAPLGIWDATDAFVQKQWGLKGNNNYDYAAIVLARRQGQSVEDVAGSKGFATDINVKKQDYTAVGYPFNKGRTKRMWACDSPFGGFDPRPFRSGPTAFGIGCDMTEGASGGGWTITGGYLASVTSFGYKGLENHLFGPQFDKKADHMRKAAGKVRFRG